MMDSAIPASEYARRRARVLRELRGAAGLVMAGEGHPPLRGFWEPNWDFYYLTGIRDEAGAAVLFDPRHPEPKRRIVLLLRPVDPEAEVWDGYRDRIGRAMRERTGFETVMRTSALPGLLRTAAQRAGRLACLHPLAAHTGPVSPDLALFRKVSERVPGVSIEDRSRLIASHRAVKSSAELKLIRRAVKATEAGFEALVAAIRPGAGEKELERALVRGFEEAGADRVAYNPIVGAGLRSTVLHYMANNAGAEEGALLVVDAGAEVGGYAADVTRAYPVSGRFTDDQRSVYELVLKAQKASIRAVRPGVRMHEVAQAARDVFEAEGVEDAFVHGIGHQMGIEVHDPDPDEPLKAGMVVTVEPGLYFPDREIGVRIEDDILVTAKGRTNLTAGILKEAAEIERAVRAAGRR